MKSFSLYLLTGISLAFLFSSCSVGPKYIRAELELPEKYNIQRQTTADSLCLPWNVFFTDKKLISLVDKALQKNSEISTALLSLKQSELLHNQSKFILLPSLDFEAGGTRSWASENSRSREQPSSPGYTDDYSAAIKLSWEADIWGKAKMQRDETLAEYFAQKENLSALRTRIIVEVAQAYYNLLLLDEELNITTNYIQFADSTINIIRLLYNAGQEKSLAIEMAEVQKKNSEALLPAIMQAIKLQENTLNIMCASYPDSIERTHYSAFENPTEIFPIGVPAMLLSRRPDIRSAEYSVIAAYAKTGQAKAAMYPSLNLSASFGTNSSLIEKWFDLPGAITKSIGASLVQPIFQKNVLKTTYNVAELEQQKADIQFKQSVITAVGEVSGALARLNYANEKMRILSQKEKSLAKSIVDSQMLYRSGMATYLEVITANNNLLQSELDKIAIKRDKFNAITDLYRSLGGGVE